MITRTVTNYFIISMTVLAVPLVMLFVYFTHGAIEPHLPGQRNTWNIQYSLHLLAALLATFFAFRFRSLIGKTWMWIIVVWNCLLAVVSIYAMTTLWGDMY